MDPDSGFVTVFKIVFCPLCRKEKSFHTFIAEKCHPCVARKQCWRLIGGLQQADTIYAIKTRKADGSKQANGHIFSLSAKVARILVLLGASYASLHSFLKNMPFITYHQCIRYSRNLVYYVYLPVYGYESNCREI